MKRIALLGMPNTGKSTLFNRLSGSSARIGNWPGITVDLHAVKTLRAFMTFKVYLKMKKLYKALSITTRLI